MGHTSGAGQGLWLVQGMPLVPPVELVDPDELPRLVPVDPLTPVVLQQATLEPSAAIAIPIPKAFMLRS
jgi:hypothetical protein